MRAAQLPSQNCVCNPVLLVQCSRLHRSATSATVVFRGGEPANRKVCLLACCACSHRGIGSALRSQFCRKSEYLKPRITTYDSSCTRSLRDCNGVHAATPLLVCLFTLHQPVCAVSREDMRSYILICHANGTTTLAHKHRLTPRRSMRTYIRVDVRVLAQQELMRSPFCLKLHSSATHRDARTS